MPTGPAGAAATTTLVDSNYVLGISQAPLYQSGSVTWTGFGTSLYQALWLFEVT